MSAEPGVVIVGAGQAGARCASALRKGGYPGAITLVGDEPELPYERPPLSKDVLWAGEDESASVGAPIFDAAYYAEQNIELRTSTQVLALDVEANCVRMAAGAMLHYKHLVLATGARARTFALPGLAATDVLTLRNTADARRIRRLLGPGLRILLIGGGFIGLEIAAAAIRLGCRVSVVEARPRLLERALSSTAASYVQALHEAQGVEFKTSSAVSRAAKTESGVRYTMSDGTIGEADLIIAGVGALPNVELATQAGLAQSDETGGGVLVDAQCRATAANVYAIGDISTQFNPVYGRHVRLESWENAESQAARAAAAILADEACSPDGFGKDDTERWIPWFWTDQYTLNLQILGLLAGTTRTVTRGDVPTKGICFHFGDQGLLGAELFNCGRERRWVKQLIALGRSIDEDALGNSSIPLAQVLAAAKDMHADVPST